VAWTPDGALLVADAGRRALLRVDGGAVTVLAGADWLEAPAGLAVAADGTVFVSDLAWHRIVVFAPGGVPRVLAGTGVSGFVDGATDVARFHQPVGLALDAAGTLYVADLSNHAVRAVAPDGTVRTVAGTGVAGYRDGSTEVAQFDSPRGVALAGPDVLYVADTQNDALRRVAGGSVATVAGGSGRGFVDGAALDSRLDRPYDVAWAAGVAFVADAYNHAVRRLAGGVLDTLAGGGQDGDLDGLGAAARFALPGGLAAREGFDLLVADPHAGRVRRIRP
jgi:sugar lactone lactonase YvrE